MTNYLNREMRMKGIHEALTEMLTKTITPEQCRKALAAYGCDESEADALMSSAPKTMVKRKKRRFKNEALPL